MQKTAIICLALLGLGVVGTLAWTVDDHGKEVSCYYSSWAFYRFGEGKFEIEDIDPHLCSIVYYGFADLSNTTWEVDILDPWFDLYPTDSDCLRMHPDDPERWCNYGGYRNFTAMKSIRPQTKWMLSFGGWNAGSGDYSVCAADPIKRQSFINDAIRVVMEYGFDGVDLDWEYPADRLGSDPNDYVTYVDLVREFSEALHANGLFFTAALAAGYDKADKGYDVPAISQYYDLMNIMGYDYSGAWQDFTAHNSPLYRRPEENNPESMLYQYNLYDTIMYYRDRGMPKEKAVLGVPTYGRGWTLAPGYEGQEGIYCNATGGNPAGPYSAQDGHYGYNEVLQALHNDTLWNLPEATAGQWTIRVDPCYRAPHMVNGPYWISYDDPDSITKKVEFMNHIDIAGAMIWSLETDDFDGNDSPNKWPLLQAINDALYSGVTFDPEADGCTPMESCGNPFPTTTEPPTTVKETTTTTTSDPNNHACTAGDPLQSHPLSCHLYIACEINLQGDWVERCHTCFDRAFDESAQECKGEGTSIYDQCKSTPGQTESCP